MANTEEFEVFLKEAAGPYMTCVCFSTGASVGLMCVYLLIWYFKKCLLVLTKDEKSSDSSTAVGQNALGIQNETLIRPLIENTKQNERGVLQSSITFV